MRRFGPDTKLRYWMHKPPMDVETRDLEVLNTLIKDNPHNASVWRTVEKLAQKAQVKLQKESESK